MFKAVGALVLMLGLTACSVAHAPFSSDELGWRAACDTGDYSACADLAHSVAKTRTGS